jgi:uncharacterized protein (TIGR00369 family)
MSSALDALFADGWAPIETDGFIGLIGPLLYKAEAGMHRFGFLAEAKHENRRGVIHGGMLAAFADRSLAQTCLIANDFRPQATIALDVRYVDAVHVGEFVEAVCELVRKTRSVVFLRGTLTAGSRIVATADGTWKLLTPERPRA